MKVSRFIGACVIGLALGAPAAAATEVLVTTSKSLAKALENARPGDVISLAPGEYSLERTKLTRAGTEAEPIVVRAAELGAARIKSKRVELFWLNAPYWVFENLDIEGGCASQSNCHHAFHIVGRASGTIIRNNRMTEFHAAIKGNGSGKKKVFPNDVVIENNLIYNRTPRETSDPVTPIDVVGGRRWVVRGNLIADFGKLHGNQISYAAFLKGGSRGGVFERNLIVCEWRHTAGTRLGLSFGGGGTSGSSNCEEGSCVPEHHDGIIRNNIVLNCPDDVGVYLNKAAGTQILNNTVLGTTGVDVRFGQSKARVANNVLEGKIRNRNGGSHEAANNLIPEPESSLTDSVKWRLRSVLQKFGKDPEWLADDSAKPQKAPGTETVLAMLASIQEGRVAAVERDRLVDWGRVFDEVWDDYCGNPRRTPPHDLGALEYDNAPCDLGAPIKRALALEAR